MQIDDKLKRIDKLSVENFSLRLRALKHVNQNIRKIENHLTLLMGNISFRQKRRIANFIEILSWQNVGGRRYRLMYTKLRLPLDQSGGVPEIEKPLIDTDEITRLKIGRYLDGFLEGIINNYEKRIEYKEKLGLQNINSDEHEKELDTDVTNSSLRICKEELNSH